MKTEHSFTDDRTTDDPATDGGAIPGIDLGDAERFLQALDPDSDFFTFQTLDDNQDRKDKTLARVLHGTLTKCGAELAELNARGAGVFVTVNATDGQGRRADNVKRVRATFVDLDGTPRPAHPHMQPHIVAETSPGRWHLYWRTDEVALDQFSEVQKRLIEFYHSDPSVHDLPRVMRVPGFLHRKGTPFVSRLVEVHGDSWPYSLDDLLAGLPEHKTNGAGQQQQRTRTDSQWGELNERALANLSAWVPKMFPTAKSQKDGYRVASADLGRGWQEDLSFTPQGIKYFGVHDMGDPRQGRRSPIDIVIEWQHLEFDAAVRWLEQALGEPKPETNAGPIGLQEWDAGDDPGPISPREWLLANQFCRGFVSSVVAAGGTGKSALRLLQFISLALGRSLCGQHVFHRCRVLLISLEDDDNELQRRISAVLLHYGVKRSELSGWLFCATPKAAKIAMMQNRVRAVGPLEQQIRDAVERRKPDLVSLDPFVKLHGLEENDSGDMDFVCDLLARLAVEFNVAVDSPHHVHKGQIAPGDANAGRGSSGVKDAARLVYTLTPMSEDEAKKFSINADDRSSYVRLDPAKLNIAARALKATWFRLIGVPIGNGTAQYPNGDTVQVIEPWAPANAWDNFPLETIDAILDQINGGLPNGQRYSNAPAAGDDRQVWKLVQSHCPDKPEAHCRTIISAWFKSELLVAKNYDDPVQRKERSGLWFDYDKRPDGERKAGGIGGKIDDDDVPF
jgi:hypothetical protein